MKALSPFWGVSQSRLATLYQIHKQDARENDRISVVQKNLADLSNNELAAMAHRINVEGMNKTSAHLIADRNRQNLYYGSDVFDRRLRARRYMRNAYVERALGETVDSVKFFYNNFKFFPTITPHPTKDKNDTGNALYRNQVSIADAYSFDDLTYYFTRNDHEMYTHRLTPNKKDTYTKETDDALDSEMTILEGTLNWLEDKQDALNEAHGFGEIDFMADDMHLDAATRRWQGGDADGKPIPAPALFALRVKGAYKALQKYVEIFDDYSELKEEREVFETLLQKMKKIYDRINEIEKLKSADDDFKKAKEEFSAVFNETPYKGESYNKGPSLTSAVMSSLKDKARCYLQSSSKRPVGKAARRIVLMHKQAGIATGRQEIRHNGEDYAGIFDNLFGIYKRK